MSEPTECGTEWGFADDCEAVSYPMTPEERRVWFAETQATSIIMGIIDDIGFGLDQILVWFDKFEELDRRNVA